MPVNVPSHAVVSSNINRVGYLDNTLFIAFNHGGIYSYADVPNHLYQSLLDAESVGKFFHQFIKGHFDYLKLEYDPFV